RRARGGGVGRERPDRGRGRLPPRRRRRPRGERTAFRVARGARVDRGRDADGALRARARQGARPQAPRGAARRVQRGHRRTALTLAYVGLGANLGDREATIRQAAKMVGAARLSSIRETEPWGYTDQPLFLNAVAEL